MDVAYVAVGIAGGSLLVSGASFGLAWRADRRAGRAETRDVERLGREEGDAEARRRAHPVVTRAGGRGGPTANPVEHDYAVKNAGAAPLSELWLWIEDANGATVSGRAGGAMALSPGDLSEPVTVGVPQPLPTAEPFRLMMEWRDLDGTHTEPTGINPPRHM